MSLPRVNSRTPLAIDDQFIPDPKPMSVANPHVAALLAAVHPRKPKQRTTFAALIILVCLTTYIFIAHSSALSPSLALRRSDSPAADQLALALETIQNSRLEENKHGLRKPTHPPGPALKLDLPQELAAVSSFLASLPQNVIPPTVDPSVPIDPQLILDFDTRGPRAKEELEALMEDVWLRNPVFVYSKFYSPVSRELKALLAGMYLRPEPTIIDVDTREDAEVLAPVLKRLTSTELPVLLIGGKTVGSVEEVLELEKKGELRKLITAAGSQINGAKRKKHRK